MKRILGNQTNVLNNQLSQLDNFYQPIGEKTIVYKFKIRSGSLYLTKYGEIDIDTISDNYQQNFQLFTGKEPITVYWNNSFHCTGNVRNNTITKKYKVGDYEVCYITGGKQISKEVETKSIYNKDYVVSLVKYNITLQSPTWEPTEDDMRDYVYLIFDKKVKSYKWLEISFITPYYNEETNKLEYCDITFESINDKYSQTGKTILDFIQLGSIGEGYAWPKETHLANGEIKVEVDTKYLDDWGCNSVQLDFTCGAALSSVFVVGRRKSKKQEDGSYIVDAPHLLFLYDTITPHISTFFYNQPNLNSYIGSSFKPTKRGIWKSYKDAVKSNERVGEYNILNTKEVMTGLEKDTAEVRKTNSNINTYTNIEKSRVFDIDFSDQLRYDNNPYCQPEINMRVQCNYVDFFNINAFVNFASYMFDYEYKETKKWKLTDTLGVLGNLVNVIVGGLDIGWTTTNILSKVENTLNLTIPCISFEDAKLALNDQAPLSLDVFHDEKSKTVLPTSTNVLTSWRFRLTDRVVDTSQIRAKAPIGRGQNGVWDLKYVGQTKFEDGSYINPDHTPFRLNLSTTKPAAPSNNDFEFIVDYIDYKVVASCDCRITAYDNANNSIYYSISETNAKARGDIRIWGNAIRFFYYDRFNVSGEIEYPNYENPPPPSDDLTAINVEITDDVERNVFDSTNKPVFRKSAKPINASYFYKLTPLYKIDAFNDMWLEVQNAFLPGTLDGVSYTFKKDTGGQPYWNVLGEDYYEWDVKDWRENSSRKRLEIFDNKVDWTRVKRVKFHFVNGHTITVPWDGTVEIGSASGNSIINSYITGHNEKYMGWYEKRGGKDYIACSSGVYRNGFKNYNLYYKRQIQNITISTTANKFNNGMIVSLTTQFGQLKLCAENVSKYYDNWSTGIIGAYSERPKWVKNLWDGSLFPEAHLLRISVFYE